MIALRPAAWHRIVFLIVGLTFSAADAVELRPGTIVKSDDTPHAGAAVADPRRIVDTHVAPYSAIGRISGLMICTGAIVLDTRIVLTTAHCVVERNGKLTHKRLAFQPGYRAGVESEKYDGEVWAVGSLRQYVHPSSHDASNDWAIIVLDRPVELIRSLMVRTYGMPMDEALKQVIILPAYGNDFDNGRVLVADPACSVTKIVWETLLHDCAVSYGGSGGPLLVQDGDWFALVGINRGELVQFDPEKRRFVKHHAAVGSASFIAAVEDTHQRLLDGRGRGCRFQWAVSEPKSSSTWPQLC